MARPKKQTVDYFPHLCYHGKTIYILEQRYQTKGYAFWFKLLEELCLHNNHYLDLNNETELEFLSAKTQFLPVETLEILDLLSRLDAIDKDLWKNKLVWCQNLIDNIADVYRNRKVEIPQKPVSIPHNPVSTPNNPVSMPDNTQSKVKESKVKEISCSSKMSEADFNSFWLSYPKKTSKKKAKEKFLKLKKDQLPFILEAIQKQKQIPQWMKDGGQFIPYPTTWLNNESWNDEGVALTPEMKEEQMRKDAYEMYKQMDDQWTYAFDKKYGEYAHIKYLELIWR